MALKQDGVHFVFCPEQGMYFRIFFVLNRVSNPQRLTYSPTLVEYCPPLPLPSLPGVAVQQMLRRMCALILFDTCNTLWGIFERPLTNCSSSYRWSFVSTMMKMIWTAEIQIIFEDMIVSVFVSTVMQSVPAAESIFEPMRDNEQNSLNPCTG